MKKILTIITFLLFTGVALAGGYNNESSKTIIKNGSSSESWSGSGAGASAEAYSNGANGSYNQNSGNNVQGSDLSNAVGNSFAPALTTTLTETCMGSTSVGAGFSGGSFSFGTTWRDSACVRRLDAREIRTYGDVQAAKEIMCDSDQVREAFKRVGRPCAADGGVYTVAAPVAPVAEAAPVPATDANAGDESDAVAKQTERMLKNADEAAASLKAKGL